MTEKKLLQQIAEEKNRQEEKNLSSWATPNSAAVRKKNEKMVHYRPPFALDRDRIFYSGAFRRYTGKTQVIYFVSLLDEQLTSRSLHTLSVAQIARTIGRFLSLNTDLIEAIALGHDLGHPPFGHDGEVFLSEISQKYGLGHFHHNIQSLRVVDRIAKKGQGLNLTFQTRDGILSHNGEVHNQKLEPRPDKTEQDLQDYIKRMEAGEWVDMMPATLEGCVVRITDTIAYIGQDIDDAIRIGLIQREDLPPAATDVLGTSNGQIIDTLVNDVVCNSYQKNYVCFSDTISQALFELKQFNYKYIYKSAKLKINHRRIQRGFQLLFEHFLESVKKNDRESEIFQHFLLSKCDDYLRQTPDEIKVRDFLAGMTDRYFSKVLQKIVVPQMGYFKIFNE
ncbi:deoxyguanosinetriphosphate triphosphohydrolase family protein [Caldithrix abyssi]